MTDLELKTIIEICNKATTSPWTSYIEGRDFASGSNFIMTGKEKREVMIIQFHY